jgi:hypothetical protein
VQGLASVAVGRCQRADRLKVARGHDLTSAVPRTSSGMSVRGKRQESRDGRAHEADADGASTAVTRPAHVYGRAHVLATG